MIFATFNALAFIHIFLTAPETKGRTLEEMDEVFDSGIRPWKVNPNKVSRLDVLAKDIEAGHVKVAAPIGGARAIDGVGGVGGVTDEKHIHRNEGVLDPESTHRRDGVTDTQRVHHHDDEKAVIREHNQAI